MFTIFCQINNLKSLVFIKKSHCYTFCFQCWIQINGHHVVFSQQATELKHSLNVKKMASLVSVSNAFHGFTLNQDGTNTILLPRFTSKPILYTKHANKLTKFHPTTWFRAFRWWGDARCREEIPRSPSLSQYRPDWFNRRSFLYEPSKGL